MTTSPTFGITLLTAGQAGAELTVNEAIGLLEAAAVGVAKSLSTSAQPGSPSNGDVYILPASPTGANWSGQDDGKIAVYQDGWRFLTPPEGILLYIQDDDVFKKYDGGAVDIANWSTFTGSGATTFTALNDVPAYQSGDAGKFVKVNSSENGVEFADANTTFAGLTDVSGIGSNTQIYQNASGTVTPRNLSHFNLTDFTGISSYGSADQFIKSTGSALTAFTPSITNMSDVGGSSPTDGQVLQYVNANSRYEPATLTAGTFQGLSDTSNDTVSSHNGEFLKVSSGTVGYSDISLLDLTDTPSAFGTANKGKFLRVENVNNADEIVFTGITTSMLNGITNNPPATAGSVLRSTGASSQAAFAQLSLSDLSDVGNVSGASNGKILKHNGSSFVLADESAAGGTFVGLTDTAMSSIATSDRGKQIIVSTDTTTNNLKLVFVESYHVFSITVQEYTGVGTIRFTDLLPFAGNNVHVVEDRLIVTDCKNAQNLNQNFSGMLLKRNGTNVITSSGSASFSISSGAADVTFQNNPYSAGASGAVSYTLDGLGTNRVFLNASLRIKLTSES